MMREIFIAGSSLVVPLFLCGYLCWTLRKIVAELKETQRQLNSSRLLSKKFDRAANLMGDLNVLQEHVYECRSGLHNTMFYVKKLRSEFQEQHKNAAQILVRLDKLEAALSSTSSEIKENVIKAYKVMRYYDVSLSPRTPFPFGDDEDGENDSSAQQLIPGNLL